MTPLEIGPYPSELEYQSLWFALPSFLKNIGIKRRVCSLYQAASAPWKWFVSMLIYMERVVLKIFLVVDSGVYELVR